MRLKCPHCGISGQAPVIPAGRLVRCPRCTELFLLPEADEFRQVFAGSSGVDAAVSPVSPSSPAVDDVQEDGADAFDPDGHELGESFDEDMLADESWLADEFPADPEKGDDDRAGLADGNLETEEIEESEELSFDETFGEEAAASFADEDVADTLSSSDMDFAASLDDQDTETVKKSNYPDFNDHQVNWKEEQPEPETAEGGTFQEQKAEQATDGEEACSLQPSEDAIQQELDEMLATTCVACDSRVAEDELYCPDCLRKKAAAPNASAAVQDHGASAAKSGKKKKALWLGIGLLGIILITLVVLLLFQWGLI